MSQIKYEINNLYKNIDKAGLAENIDDYKKYYDLVFNQLDYFDDILSKSKYLNGDDITDDDIDLYKVLIRFDIIFYFAYKLNKKHIWEYDNLFRFLEELYYNEITKEFNDLDNIKKYFYLFRSNIKNPYHIIPSGGDPRDRFKTRK